ncbi:unnamed protein product, partial [Allacma fusca]
MENMRIGKSELRFYADAISSGNGEIVHEGNSGFKTENRRRCAVSYRSRNQLMALILKSKPDRCIFAR